MFDWVLGIGCLIAGGISMYYTLTKVERDPGNSLHPFTNAFLFSLGLIAMGIIRLVMW